MPRPGKFIPVGHYLPSAVLLGASITLGGFDCPDLLQGVLYLLPGYALALLCWVTQMPALLALAFPWVYIMLTDRHKEKRRSARSLMRLLYGALIPTLAMVNFPQAVLLALFVLAADVGLLLLIFAFGSVPLAVGGHYIGLHKLLAAGQAEWALGNVTYPATYAVIIPLIAALWSFPSSPLSLIGALWCLPSLPS